MEMAARSYVTAAAAVAAGSMIAVTPAMSLGVGDPARPFELASSDSIIVNPVDELAPLVGITGPLFADPLLNLQAEELSANAGLLSEELAANGAMVARELSNQPLVGSLLGDLPNVAVVDRLLDGANLSVATVENLLNGILGAENIDPAAINASLLVDGATATSGGITPGLTGVGGMPSLSGQVGGVEGALGNDVAAIYLALGAVIPADLLTDFQAFNQTLLSDELLFNTNLRQEELAAEVAALGSNSALNGSVDRLINIDNLPLGIDENLLNSLIGATSPTVSPADLTASLLTGVGGTATDPANVFDTGLLGGLENIYAQDAALLTDLAGLNSADITSAFAPGVFEPTVFSAAVSDLLDFNAFSNLAPDLGSISTDFGAIATELSTAFTTLF